MITSISQAQFLNETEFKPYTDKILGMYGMTPASFFDFYSEYSSNESMRNRIGEKPVLQIEGVFHQLFKVIELMWLKAKNTYGVILYDLIDHDFAWVALRQEENPEDPKEWCCFKSEASFSTPTLALESLSSEMY